jgi:hypothetical protein
LGCSEEAFAWKIKKYLGKENKKRMEEVGLMNLAHDLKKLKLVIKKLKKRKIELHEAWRSLQVAAKQVLVY